MKYLKPAFFIIGERKCATSSLYRWLIAHPQVLPCRLKEPQYFSRPAWFRWSRRNWYRSLFPETDAQEAVIEWFVPDGQGFVKQALTIPRDPELPCITGEASANTFAQVPPERLHKALPEAHLILCLRHPVDRAYAHYRMLARFAAEGRRIPFRVTNFRDDFRADIKRPNGGYFAGVSLYTERLKRWTSIYGRECITIVRMEDLQDIRSAQAILGQICAALGIGLFDFSTILETKENVSGEQLHDKVLRQELMVFFADDIRALETFTGRNFQWTP